MDIGNLYDPLSASIVGGGTLGATLLRCGLRDSLVTLRTLAGLPRRRFDPERARGRLAELVRGARQDGLLRVTARPAGDSEIDRAVDEMLARRALPALDEAHARLRERRRATDERAVRTLAQAAELAPVFGLAGTLISLAQLRAGGFGGGDFGEAIGMAVLTTLYGLLLAHVVLAPLSRLVERRADREDRARESVVAWLGAQLAGAAHAGPRDARLAAIS